MLVAVLSCWDIQNQSNSYKYIVIVGITKTNQIVISKCTIKAMTGVTVMKICDRNLDEGLFAMWDQRKGRQILHNLGKASLRKRSLS